MAVQGGRIDISTILESAVTQRPLFPLPNMLLYPGGVAPLHLFEPRYRRLMEDLMASGGQEMVLGTLMPDWEDDYFGLPPVSPIAGLGKVLECQKDPEGNFNLLLQGISRVRIADESLAEVPEGELPYRLVSVESLAERHYDHVQEQALHRALLEQLATTVEDLPDALQAADINLLADLLLVQSQLPLSERLRIFSLLDGCERATAILIARQDQSAPSSKDPHWS
jgi:Lon protease-like protein